MNLNSLTIDKFNIIEDNENYYVFRALNNSDSNDIKQNITSNEDGINRIRTDRERFEEENTKAKYSAESNISLEEVWDHIKIRYIKETNCISLSSNANVSIDYGQSYNQQYVMVKIPKTEETNIYNAGQYMLEEIEKEINNVLSTIPQDSKILDIINQIDNETKANNIKAIVAESYDGIKKTSEKFSEKDNKLAQKKSVIERFDRKQYFTEDQQLEYNKIIAKLTALETSGNLRSILPTQRDNSSLIATVGLAFSSGELIHYKDIEKNELIEVQKEMMDILSLIQQIKSKGENSEEIKDVENKILKYIKEGYKFTKNNETLILTNGKNNINVNDISDIQEKRENIPIEEIYQLTQGKIRYEKAKIAIEFAKKLSQSKIRALEYAEMIKTLTNASDELINRIKNETYSIDKDIISRENNEGLKISESVNIGLPREERYFVSNREQLSIINKIQNLNKEQLKEIIETNKLSLDLLSSIIESEDEITENKYFAEVIVDELDFNKIYNTIQGNREKTEEERQKLLGYLENVDCKKIYNSFIKAGINQNEVSRFIINLLLNNGYKGYSLEELSKLDNLDEIVDINVKNGNLKNGISALKLDYILGIRDDLYQIENTEIKLRDYQYETYKKIENIFKDKRFSAMILPTGAGKSFVAMSEIMNFKNQDSNKESGNSNIIFVAPQNAILHQFEVHILKNILKRKIITEDEIKKLEKEGKPIPKNVIQPKDFKKVLNQEFPSLKMFCYATLAERDEEWFEGKDADLIILDELHRSGAKTWEPKIRKLIELNPKAKILGMTATPVRDTDSKDMARTIAEITGDYTSEELDSKNYLASEMDLLDAMQENYVVDPKIVTFDYSLKDSEEYKEVKRMLTEEKDPTKQEELKKIYKEMTNIIKESEKIGIDGILAQNIKKTNGKYIVFLPQNSDNQTITSEEYVKKEIEKVKEYFKNINPNIKTSYLLSNRDGKDKENAKALDDFENSNDEALHLLFAIDMLNEGVHVDGINGAIMMRPISENSKILYLQQIGRCIFSEDPENPTRDEDKPIIFDMYNNYLAHNMDREANKTNPTSDLQKLQAVINWIEKHKGYIPDINSENIKEAKKAITLKNIQKKYIKYLEGIENKNLNKEEINQIEQIIDLGKSIELWDLQIPDRIIPPGEKDILRNNTFKVTGTQKDFIDLFKKARKITKDRKLSDDRRIKEILLTLDVLSEYGIEINNQIIPNVSTLKDVLEEIPESIKRYVTDEIEELGIDSNYKIGEEYNFAKEKFYNAKKIFEEFDFETLKKCGILETFISKSGYKRRVDISYNGFLEKNCPSKFKGLNLETGFLYDKDGYNINGYDRYGYDKSGWSKENINKATRNLL